jgi:CotS family spore coat protein
MIKNYLVGRKTKTDFELLAVRECPGFFAEGLEALDRLKASDYEQRLSETVQNNRLCHGDFNYHNIYTDGGEYLIAGFSQMRKDLYVVDLYNFMRKLMEKYDWDIKMGYLMLREYDCVNTLSAQDVKILGAMFSYPEKFWKILNYYFNANKAWIPNKNMEKLKLAVNQNRMRREFVRTLYG